jgi:hypothetical protein
LTVSEPVLVTVVTTVKESTPAKLAGADIAISIFKRANVKQYILVTFTESPGAAETAAVVKARASREARRVEVNMARERLG